jgi:rhodanese-related sulfurtransferase
VEISQIPAHDWEQWVKENDAVVLDVREPYEWELGTLPGAIKIRLADLPSSLDSLDPSRPTLVVCRSGGRSLQAAAFLTMSGFELAANMAGGMHALGMQP